MLRIFYCLYQGMVQAAVYIRDKLKEDSLLTNAFGKVCNIDTYVGKKKVQPFKNKLFINTS